MALTDNLVSFWKLDEASGNNRADSVGSNTLLEPGTVGSATGKIGDCASFVETDHLSIADNASLSLTGSITICAWVNKNASLNSGSFPGIVTKWAHTNLRSYALMFDPSGAVGGTANRFLMLGSGAGTSTDGLAVATSFGAPTAGTWNFVVGFIDLDNDLIGISVNDGTVDTAAYTPSAVFDGTADFAVGQLGTSSNVWYGLIDAVGIWSRKLSTAEITELYNSGTGLEYPFGGGSAAPVANAGLDQTRMEFETVMLDSSQSTDDVGIVSRLWEQVSGTAVTINNDTSVNPTFTAPDVATPTNLVFKVTVTDGDTQTNEDQVTIRVVPIGSTEWLWHTPQEAGFEPNAFYTSLVAAGTQTPMMVIRSGRVIGTRGNITTPGFTWSASKSICTLIFGRLLQLGSVDYSDVVPGSDNPTAPTATLAQFMAMLSDFGLNPHSPGDYNAYNNAAVHHYADYLRDTYFTGDTDVEFLENSLAIALGFEDTITYAGFFGGWDGGWSISTRDLARLNQLVLNRGLWDGTQLVSAAFCDELFKNQIPFDTEVNPDTDDLFYNQSTGSMAGLYSYGWWLKDEAMGGSASVNEVAKMSGAYGTSSYVSRRFNLIAVSCNAGGVITNDATVKISGAAFDAIVDSIIDSAPSIWLRKLRPSIFSPGLAR